MNAERDISELLAADNVLTAIYPDANRSRVIWTASTLLRCLGIAFYPNIPVSLHRKANRALKTLWRDGRLVRRIDLRRDHRIPEAAYMRLEDKPGMCFVACQECGFPRFVHQGTTEPCRRCGGDDIAENDYYPVCTGRKHRLPATPPSGEAMVLDPDGPCVIKGS